MKRLSVFLFLSVTGTCFSQQLQWANGFGSVNNGNAYSVIHDQVGNAVFVGSFDGTRDFDPGPSTYDLTYFGIQDAFVGKYDPNGNLLWAFQLGVSGGMTEAWSLAVDASGNILVSGFYTQTIDLDPGPGTATVGGTGFFMSKYDAGGNYLWGISFPTAATVNDISFDFNQDIVVVGSMSGSGDFDPGTGIDSLTTNNSTDLFLAKFSSGGNYLWGFNIGNSGNVTAGLGIVTNSNNEITISGHFAGTNDFDPGNGASTLISQGLKDIYLAKYDMNGNLIWSFNVGGLQSDNFNSMATDQSGDYYLTGAFYGNADFDPGSGVATLTTSTGSTYLAKYSSAGNYIWAFKLDYAGFNSLAATSSGLYATGAMNGTTDFDPGPGSAIITSYGSGDDIVIASYTGTGAYQWANNIGCVTTSSSSGNSVIADNQNIWFCGMSKCISADFDPGPGTVNLSSVSNGIFLAKYTSIIGISEIDNGKAIQLFPNPVQSSFSIEPERHVDHILIQDILGNTVLETGITKNIDVSNLSNGVYFAIMREDKMKYKQKFIISK